MSYKPKLTIETDAAAVDRLIRFLSGDTFDKTAPLFKKIVEFLKRNNLNIASEARERLKEAAMKAFDVNEEELSGYILDSVSLAPTITYHPEVEEERFLECLPKGGFCEKYALLTSKTEAPLVFHIMAALATVGATFNRRIWMHQGFYNVYSNISIVLIAPAGQCKKTSAVSMAKMLCPPDSVNFAADKTTPEAVLLELKDAETRFGNANTVFISGELSILFGKQKYNEGMIPLFNELVECKKEWSVATVGRGRISLNDIFVSLIGASTLDLFGTSMNTAVFDGGLISRLILVVQESSSRKFATPTFNFKLVEDLQNHITHLHNHLKGEFIFTPTADAMYNDWYVNGNISRYEHPRLVAYRERKGDHVKRIAMILHALEHGDMKVCEGCLHNTLSIMAYLEKQLPRTFETMFESRSGEETELIIRMLKASDKGIVEHSVMLRRLRYRMNAKQFRDLIDTLTQSGWVKEVKTAVDHYYMLKRWS
jgi:hypothetical protein